MVKAVVTVMQRWWLPGTMRSTGKLVEMS